MIQFLINCSGPEIILCIYFDFFNFEDENYPFKVRDSHNLCLNLFGGQNLPRIEAKNGRGTCELTKAELKGSEHMLPILPISKGFKMEIYRHNG